MAIDPTRSFSQILEGFLHLEDIRAYILYKFKSIGDSDIFYDLDKIYNNDKYLK